MRLFTLIFNDIRFKEVMSTLPTVNLLLSNMDKARDILYLAWTKQLAKKLLNFEFSGFIELKSLELDETNFQQILHLPNVYIRFALCKLKSELDSLGYDYSFKFEDVLDNDNYWGLSYKIELPEDLA